VSAMTLRTLTLARRDDNSILMASDDTIKPQCETAEAIAPDEVESTESSEGVVQQDIVSLADYLAERIRKHTQELQRVEKQTGTMMNQLIREVDHGAARRLQRDIGRLDSYHTEVKERIQRDTLRYQRYSDVEL